MSLDKAVKFKKDGFKVVGLVDLGNFTPEADKTKIGDHALVVMFQPFQGQWIQAVGAFLSAGSVKGEVLEKIVLEAILLLENHGFFVDCVNTDGASWNRTMWNLFGISKDNNSCQHPCNATRKLYFSSDFPHLVKNLWTRIVSKKELDVSILVLEIDIKI